MRNYSNKILADKTDWLEIDVSTPKFPSAIMLIEKNDWDLIQKFPFLGRIYAWSRKGSDVVYAMSNVSGGTIQKIHKLIYPNAKMIDHSNMNGLDNRRFNLRPCTKSQNNANKKLCANNTSGYKGVSRNRHRWRATICVLGKVKHLGTYNTPKEAHLAYCNAAEEYYGEFAHKG